MTHKTLGQEGVSGLGRGQTPICHHHSVTFLIDLCRPVDVRVVCEPGPERGGVGGQVLVCDVQHLRQRALVADGDLTGLRDRAMVVDIHQC